MDFVSRHTTVATSASSSAEHRASAGETTTSAAQPPVASGAEEPEYLARYLVVKHSWRGRYKRILCISHSSLTTLDPSTLSVTNSYDVGSEYEGAVPLPSRDVNSQEFTISVRTDSRSKFKGIKFSSPFRASILTELQRLRGSGASPVAEFPVLHLRRRTSEWAPFKLKITAVGVELVECQSGDLRWCLDFRDMASPAILLLADNYGKKNIDNAPFVLCPLYGRKSKAFLAPPGSLSSTIISILTKTAKSTVGLSLSLDSSQSLTTSEYIKQRAKEAVGADETPYGGWLVMRLRSAAHGTANVSGLSLGIGPKGGLGEQGDSVPRQLILTKVSLVERRPANYEVQIPLGSRSSINLQAF